MAKVDCFVAELVIRHFGQDPLAPGNDEVAQAPASAFASMKPEPAPVPAPGQVDAPTMHKRSIGVR